MRAPWVVQHALMAATFAVGALVGAVPVSAQSTVSQFGVIDGAVVTPDGEGIARVEIVLLDNPKHAFYTLSAGGYRIDSVPAGTHLVRFRRMGVQPTTIPIQVNPNDITSADVVLQLIPHELAGVKVQSANGEMEVLPSGLADRMKNGNGVFVTADDIAREKPINTTEIFQHIPGAQLTKSGGVNNTRGIISIVSPGCMYGIPVYLDGQVMGDPHAMADTVRDTDLIDLINPKDIVAIEVYRGASEVPATLPQNPCGGVFIWTRHD